MINMSSFSEWERGVANRNRFVLKELLRRSEIRKVLLVDFLPFTTKRALRNYYQNILHSVKGEKISEGFFDQCVRYEGGVDGGVISQRNDVYIYSTIQSVWNESVVIEKLQQIVRKLEFENILLWSYQPMFVGYFKKFGERLSVFDAVDNWMENIHFAKYRNRLKKNYGIIAEEADFIFTVAEDIVKFFRGYGRGDRVYWIPNGVDLEHFLSPKGGSLFKEKFSELQHPIIGYIGTIQNRVDFDLIEYIAQKKPTWAIVLAGPTWPVYLKKIRKTPEPIKRLRNYKNVLFIGSVPYDSTPYVVNQFDVGIIPHKIDAFVKSMNPMKMYDYLAAKKPIVSTPGAGMELFRDFILEAHSGDEFLQKIEEGLKTDSNEMKNARLRIIQDHTYKKRVDKMMKHIYEKL